MAKFRKKPVVIEAVKFLGPVREIEGDEPQWYCAARSIDPGEIGAISYRDGCMHIGTLEGVMKAMPGDWIIRGVKHELYPCKPDIFAATYDPAD